MIALFDSGYGGVTVLKPIMKLLPQYDYLYLGDNARAPYGNHSNENIIRFTETAVRHLFEQGVKLIIFACNTASSVALRHCQEKFIVSPGLNKKNILGVLIPVAEKAAQEKGSIAVIGTKATINSDAYQKEIHKINPQLNVFQYATPLLVPLIEEGWHNKPETNMILKKYLRPIKSKQVKTLILGCTHYPIIKDKIQRYMGKKVKILTSGNIVAQRLKDYLQRHPEIEQGLSKSSQRSYHTTDDPLRFQQFVHQNLGFKIPMPKKVQL